MTRRKRNSSRINKNEGAVHHHTGEEGPSDQDSIGEKFTFAQSEHSLDTDGKNISDLLSGEVNLNDHHEPISNSLSERELNETPDKLENAFNQGEQSDCDTEKPQNEEFAANTPIDIETKIIDQGTDEPTPKSDVKLAVVASSFEDNSPEDHQIKEQPSQKENELIGDYLNRHREMKDMSLKYISQQTKVGLSKLEMLEKNNLDGLPDKAYVTGYVKILSKILGLNEREALDILSSTYHSLQPGDEIPVAVPPIERNSSAAPLVILGIMGVVIFLATTFFIGKNEKTPESTNNNTEVAVDNDTTIKKVETVVSEGQLTTQEKTNNSDISVESQATTALKDSPTETIPEKIEANSAEAPPLVEKVVENPKEETIEEVAPENTVSEPKEEKDLKKEISFRKMTKVLYEINTSASKEVTFAGIPANFRTSGVVGKQNLVIAATKSDAWMTLKTDDNPVKKVILKKGKSLYLSASEIRLFIGNLDGIKLILNGKLVNVVSKNGVKSLVFPQQNKKNYHLPLFIFHDNGKVQTSDEYIEENNLDI